MKTIKNELKTMAKEIREMKSIISKGMSNGLYKGTEQYELILLKDKCRYTHIAYCMVRGREYSEIENTTRPGNEINFSKLNTLIETFKNDLAKRNPEKETQDA